VLMSSVLNILDQHTYQPRVEATKGRSTSEEYPKAATRPEVRPGQATDARADLEVRFKLLRPLLPEALHPPSLLAPRAYEDFVRALEDEKRAMRPNVVDLFE
jgi:hypothetical protein